MTMFRPAADHHDATFEPAPDIAFRNDRFFSIRALASEFGVSFRTLRFYEDRNLLSPIRQGASRLYSEHDRRRLQTILLLKGFGFSLSEVKLLLPAFLERGDDPRQLSLLRRRLEAQQADLEAQRDEMNRALVRIEHELATLPYEQ